MRLDRYSDEELREVLQFFDCDALRGSYTGLIADLRRELTRRAGR